MLPLVDAARISLQGTSLGGFVAATVAGLDGGYDNVFILLAGGDLAGVLARGKRDAAKVRERLVESGMTAEQIGAAMHAIEPTRLAHRYRPDRTWIFSARHDDVVPPGTAHCWPNPAAFPTTITCSWRPTTTPASSICRW